MLIILFIVYFPIDHLQGLRNIISSKWHFSLHFLPTNFICIFAKLLFQLLKLKFLRKADFSFFQTHPFIFKNLFFVDLSIITDLCFLFSLSLVILLETSFNLNY